MMKLSLRAGVFAFAVAIVGAAQVAAQTPPPPPPEAGVSFGRNVDIRIEGAAQGNFEFMTAPIAVESEPIAGAPYSAEAITEVVQSLADGNRIVRQSKAEIARDGAGRTRREQGLSVLGPMVNDPIELRHVQISDPGTHTIIMLDPQHRTAFRMPALNVRLVTGMAGRAGVTMLEQSDAGPATAATFESALPVPPPPGAIGGTTFFYSAEATGEMTKPKIESLGKQFMEGVEAEGTRTTFTIPSGQIGNELPINMVSERWFSQELKILVMSRQSDPRFGETTYRLTNIVRGEPSAALFEVPPDFTVEEQPRERDVIFRKTGK